MSERVPEPAASGRDVRGISIVEVLVALVVFAVAIVGLTASAGLAVRQTARANGEMEMWAAVQRAADSLIAEGAGDVTDGSGTVAGYPMSWWVIGTDSQEIGLRYAQVIPLTGVKKVDTLILHLPE